MKPAETYELLRTLTSPVVAVTSRRGDKLNGLISDGAIRASIVPDVPRLGVFIHKFNFSHDMIWEAGAFGLHVLNTGQVDLVERLGFVSGRDRDKLAALAHRPGEHTGAPILKGCYCWFECRVCNVMDTGSSTFFMGDVLEAGAGSGQPMEPAFLRERLTDAMRREYAARLATAQQAAREASTRMRSVAWRGLEAQTRPVP
jgi:flavin reductase (DIM6/NTAB) family NADH-FMN oxidoreductase RutF